MGLGAEALRTLSVVAIVYGSQATIYAIRERRQLWGLRPTIWLVLSSVADLLIISTLAIRGIAMAPLPLSVLAGEFAAAVAFGLVLDGVKTLSLHALKSRRDASQPPGRLSTRGFRRTDRVTIGKVSQTLVCNFGDRIICPCVFLHPEGCG
jgi:hypothetical protein